MLQGAHVTITRDAKSGRIVDCVIDDGAQTMSLPITGFEYDHRANDIGIVKLGVHGLRVHFEERP